MVSQIALCFFYYYYFWNQYFFHFKPSNNEPCQSKAKRFSIIMSKWDLLLYNSMQSITSYDLLIVTIYYYNFLPPVPFLWDTRREREGSSFLFLYTFELKEDLRGILTNYWFLLKNLICGYLCKNICHELSKFKFVSFVWYSSMRSQLRSWDWTDELPSCQWPFNKYFCRKLKWKFCRELSFSWTKMLS